MSDFSRITLTPAYVGKLRMRSVLFEPRDPLPAQEHEISRLDRFKYTDLVRASLSRHLNFSEAFAAMCYALRASNAYLAERHFGDLQDFGELGNLLAAREMLSGLAMKEAWAHLTPDEVAGLVAATMLDVVRFPDYGEYVFENCGMGGDIGVQFNGEPSHRKTINGSTLSTLVLASMGIRTAKHGSYSNTSAVGSTDAIEKFGVRVDVPSMDVQVEMVASGFHFTDAHAWKTVHDLSHAEPRRETVNHVIGPMSPPIGPETVLDKIVGVSEKLHPDIVARALVMLGEKRIFNLRNAAVICGLNQVIDPGDTEIHKRVRNATVLDEMSPYASVVSLVRKGKWCGAHVLRPSMFGVTFRDPRSIFIKNETDEIMQANRVALSGEDDGRQLPEYLAMNAAMGLYVVEYLENDSVSKEQGPSEEMLRDAFGRCLKVIQDGTTDSFLHKLVQLSSRLA